MIVGFGFTKLNAEKGEPAKGKIDINNNVAIKNVQEDSFSLGKDKQQNVIKFNFEFTSKYEPNVGSILFEGELLYMEDSKKAKEILSDWKKDKKLPKEMMAGLLNTILTRCNVQALILSQQVNLPPPIPLPKVQMQTQAQQAERNYIG
ncbi:hypothetical protein HYV80_03635 [Candidatus Woesearchaeota archaeon]|nr:hypothetical protein [Candidatus Woesearchaeota archaeon]